MKRRYTACVYIGRHDILLLEEKEGKILMNGCCLYSDEERVRNG